jgi:FkbM family methyltransferase
MRFGPSSRLDRFLAKPAKEKHRVLAWHVRNLLWHATGLWKKVRDCVPVLRRMEPGFLFLAWNDVVREAVLSGDFEKDERRFVERFLQPGMTVLDVGAYYGLYALTASAKVGSRGRVIAFEPSPLQRKRLRLHLWLNRYENVSVEDMALSSADGEHDFFVATGGAEGFSGLRFPDVSANVRSIRVNVMTVDKYLRQRTIPTVDFIKLDVEGGELDFFKGAENLLRQRKRPVILCELQDVRARAWGHTAEVTASFVESCGFRWFKPLPDGSLWRLPCDFHEYEGNFVAVPTERMDQIVETHYK